MQTRTTDNANIDVIYPRLKAVGLEPQSFVKGLCDAWNTFKEGK